MAMRRIIMPRSNTIGSLLCVTLLCVVSISVRHLINGSSGQYDVEPVDLSEKHFVIIIPSFNNAAWYQKNLETLWSQDYHNFRVIYIDDCSADDTAKLVEEYMADHPHHFTMQLIKNEHRRGAMANLYHAIHACADNEIIVTYDGDDFFAHAQVLCALNRAYQQQEAILMTYGQYVTSRFACMGICKDFPASVVRNASYRGYPWVSSHLRSFYAGLFKKIKREDLMIDGDFFAVTWDQALMFPMLEMAAGRYKFIPDVLYIYNDENPINDYKVRLPLMQRCEFIIRHRPAYEPLPVNFVFE